MTFLLRGLALAGILTSGLASCGTTTGTPLVFGQKITLGIGVGPAPEAANMPQITVGLKQDNVAVVPTVMPADVTTAADGSEVLYVPGDAAERHIASHGADKAAGVPGKQDALSTFGSFSSNSSASAGGTEGNGAGVELGVFFATGVAAQNLSEGFRCALASSSNQNACTYTVTESGN